MPLDLPAVPPLDAEAAAARGRGPAVPAGRRARASGASVIDLLAAAAGSARARSRRAARSWWCSPPTTTSPTIGVSAALAERDGRDGPPDLAGGIGLAGRAGRRRRGRGPGRRRRDVGSRASSVPDRDPAAAPGRRIDIEDAMTERRAHGRGRDRPADRRRRDRRRRRPADRRGLRGRGQHAGRRADRGADRHGTGRCDVPRVGHRRRGLDPQGGGRPGRAVPGPAAATPMC